MTLEEIKSFDGKNIELWIHKYSVLNVIRGQLRLQGPKKKSLCIYHGEKCVFLSRLLFPSEIAAVIKIVELEKV